MKFGSISDITTLGLPIGSSLAVMSIVLTCLIIRWRTGSSLTILARLWNVFHGKTAVTVPFIRDHLDGLCSVMKLRFTTGAPVRTEQHALRLTSWSDKHEENLIDAVRCGPYFDFDRPGLKERSAQPGRIAIAAIGAVLITLLLTISAAVVLIIPERAILKLNATGTWFTLNSDSARPLFSGQGLILKNCAAVTTADVAASGFNASEIRILCDAVKSQSDTELSAYVRQNIQSQRALSVLIITVLLWWTLPILSFLRHCATANAMRERLRVKAMNASSMHDTAVAERPVWTRQHRTPDSTAGPKAATEEATHAGVDSTDAPCSKGAASPPNASEDEDASGQR